MAFDEARGEVILFGGSTTTSFFSDTWAWNGRRWRQLSPPHSPGARAYGQMAYDPRHGQLVLFGGIAKFGAMPADTWLWDGADWRQASPALAPPGTFDEGMTFFPKTGTVVLYHGGSAFSSSGNHLFSRDGRTWTELARAGGPPPTQSQGGMSVDPVRGVLVLMAEDVASTNLQQWESDGQSWTHRASATPPGRWGVQTVTDQRHQTIVLFGGLGKNDTWLWDGSGWTQRFPLPSPPVRTNTGPMPGMA